MKDGLTAIQRKVLSVIRDSALAGEPTPSLRELCDQFGWRSTGTARDHVAALIRKGLLERSARRRHRGLHLREQQEPGVALPILGGVIAGRPTPAHQAVEGYVSVPYHLGGEGHFVLAVSGDSMMGAAILDGDQVVVRPSIDATDGDIVVATIDGETTLKRLRTKNGRTYLVAENPQYKPLEVRSVDSVLHGVVVGLLRSYTTPLRRRTAVEVQGG